MLLVDHDACTIFVPAKGAKRARVAVEDVRLALPDDSFDQLVQSAIYAVDDSIDDAIESNQSLAVHTISDDSDDSSTEHHEDADFSGSGHHSSPTD